MQNKLKSIVAVVAIVLTVGLLWHTNRTAPPATPTMDDVVAEAEAGGYELVSTEELAAMREQKPNLLLVDTRQGWEYRAGHIEGAVLFPMEPTAWARWTNRDDLAELLGPDKDRPVVFY